MPGGKGFVESPHWFSEAFGFEEGSYAETHRRFTFADGTLTSTANNRTFYVGPWETPSLEELRERVFGGDALAESGETGLTFQNVVGSAQTLHQRAENAGAVFQVASQFNCLEMVSPGTRPEDGVTRYYCDATQGPACALSCPAATVFRNYFVGPECQGQAGRGQIDCLAPVGNFLGNPRQRFWKMSNGYSMPDAKDGIAKLAKLLRGNRNLASEAAGKLQVGVHWDTEVKSGNHRVCQVFSSAVPVSYAKAVRSSDWEPLARLVLAATYEATLAVATLLARERGERVTVFLTAVGGGAFGNRSMWIVGAIEGALKAYAQAPLDVRLVHFSSTRGAYSALEKGRPKAAPKRGGSSSRSPRAAVAAAANSSAPPPANADEPGPNRSTQEGIKAFFERLDENGDGVIDEAEFTRILSALDPSLTEEKLLELFEAADADDNGEVHYTEFIDWVFAEDSQPLVSLFLRETGQA